ncbi:MAG: hypothetical protein C4293_01960 [Nitrospiraceae bacterium]
MKCGSCKKANRALFTRLLSSGQYIILCDLCLQQKVRNFSINSVGSLAHLMCIIVECVIVARCCTCWTGCWETGYQ